MSRPIIAVAALGVALCWLLYATGHGGRAEAATAVKAVSAAAAEPSGDRQALAELSSTVTRLQAELDAVKRTSAASQPPQDAPTEPVPGVAHMSHEEIVAYEREHSARVAAEVDAKLERESIDPQWAPSTEDAMQHALGALALPGTRFESAECRSSLCRLKLGHDGLDTIRSLSTTLTRKPPFDGMSTFLHYDDARATLYAARPGYERVFAP